MPQPRQTAIPEQEATSAEVTKYLDDFYDSAVGIVNARNNRSFGDDVADQGREMASTFASIVGSVGFAAESAGIPGGTAVRNVGENAVDYWQDRISEVWKEDQQTKFLSDEEGKIFDEGIKNPRKIANLVFSNLPFMFTGGAVGAGITKGLLTQSAKKYGAGLIPKSQVIKAGIIGSALGEGSVAGPLNAKQAYDEIVNIPFTRLAENESFQEAYRALPSDMPLVERMTKARDAVARTSAAWVGIMTGASTAVLGAPSGVWIARLLNKETGKTVFGTMAKGFVLEGFGQELPQTIAEELAAGAIINALDPTRPVVGPDFAENVFGGTLAGSLTGATIGAAAAESGRKVNLQSLPDKEEPDRKGPPPQNDNLDEELAKILGLNQERDEPQIDKGEVVKLKGEPTKLTETSAPIGATARYITPEGRSFIGRAVARAVQPFTPESAAQAGLEGIEFEDAEGNPVAEVDVPGLVLRKDDETIFVPDGAEVTLLDEDETSRLKEIRDVSRDLGLKTGLIADEYKKIEELLPQYLEKYPAGTAVTATDPMVVELQRTVESLKAKVGEKKAKELVGEMTRTAGLIAQGPTQAQAEQEGSDAVAATDAAQSPGQLRTTRAALSQEAKSLRSQATQASALGFLAGKKGGAQATTLGINKEEAEAEGIDTAAVNNVGGRIVFTKGGMSMEDAAELMNESGQFGRDITKDDVINIINDQINGKFTGESQLLTQRAAEAESKVAVLDAQIEALKTAKSAKERGKTAPSTAKAFEAVREAVRNAVDVFGDQSGVQSIEDALRAGKLEQIYAGDEYFDTIAKGGEFRVLSDLISLAEDHDADAVDELLNISGITDKELAEALLEIINNEQQADEQADSGEATTESAEETDDAGPADVEKPIETSPKPGVTAEPTAEDKPEVKPEPEPEIEVTDEQVAKTLEFIAGPFEEIGTSIVDNTVNSGMPEDVALAALAKLEKDGTVVKDEGLDRRGWVLAKPKGVKNPSDSAVNKAKKAIMDVLLEDNRLVGVLATHAEDADTTDIRIAVKSAMDKALGEAYSDAWTGSEYFTAWSIAKLAKMRFNKAGSAQPEAFPDQFYNSLVSQALRRSKLQQKSADERIRNRAIAASVGSSLRDIHKKLADEGTIDSVDFAAISRKFIQGFRAAVDGKARALLSADKMEQQGFVAGRDWGQTEIGRAFQRGKVGKKKEGIGPRLQRIHDSLGEQEWTDAEKMLRDVYQITNRAKLFDIDPEQTKKTSGREPTGGARRALDKVRSQYQTFPQFLANQFGLFTSGAPNQAVEKYAKKQESDGKFDEFQQRVRELAEFYVRRASDIASVFETQNTISGIVAEYSSMAFKNGDVQSLSEWGEDTYKGGRGVLATPPRWSLNIYLKRLADKESDPYVTKERTKALRWKKVEQVVVTNSDRNGKDVTAEEFAQRFGIAGVTFGNWGTSKERINHLNWMWDSFNDIAKIMGIKPSMIGEGNTLHIAIGALGRGGKHSAHYSPNHPVDPDNPALGVAKVINVTNKNGDGSVGHEWFHSLDFSLDDRISGNMGVYQQELVQMMRTLPKNGLTPESFMDSFVSTFFGAMRVDERGELVRDRNTSTVPGTRWDAPAAEKLKAAIQFWLASSNTENENNPFNNHQRLYKEFLIGPQSRYYADAKKLDNYVVDDYWSSPVEMIARAGESFLVDKLVESEAVNNYLVNDAFSGDNAVGPHTGYKGNPYPSGDERKQIKALYEQWAKDIIWKADKTPTISSDAVMPIKSFAEPFYDQLRAFLDNFDDRVATLEAESRAEAKQIKERIEKENRDRAADIEALIEQTLESTDDSVVDENVGIEELDDDALDKMLADANNSINESKQETSDADEQLTDEQLGEEGAEGDGGEAGSRDNADSALDATGAGRPRTGPRKGQAGRSGDGGRSGGDAGGRGTGEAGAAGDTEGLGEEGLAGTGGESAKPGKRSKGRDSKRLSAEENRAAAKAAAKRAAEAGISGLGDALTGLGELFGGSGKMNAFPTFDEQTYQKAKPHFVDSYNKFVMAGQSISDWFTYMLRYFRDTFGIDVTPMLKRFAQEARSGDLNLNQRTGTRPNQEKKAEEIINRENGDELTDSVFDEYKTTFETPEIVIPEGWQTEYHPGKLVQAAAMASVPLPEVSYSHHLPAKITNNGWVSPAQIEQVILAGSSFENILESGARRGFFIGDGTGVGKGREIAAIMIDQMMAGKGDKKAVWFSESFKLFDDAVRDYAGVTGETESHVKGSKADVQVFIGQGVNSLKDRKSGILFQTYTTARQKQATKSKDKDGNQVSSMSFSKVDMIVDWLGKDFDGVIAFDEAHSMANSLPSKTGEPSSTAVAMRELRDRLPNARLLFVTATGATELENMGYLERLGLWGPDTAFEDVFTFVSELNKGGKNVMEMIAHTMKAKGVYNARQLSWDGVRHDELVHTMTDGEKAQWNAASDLFVDMEKEIAKAAILTGLKRIDQEHKTGQFVNLTKSQTKAREQDFMLMMLTGFKAETTINHAIDQINQGHTAIIQLTQTGESATKRALNDAELQEELEREGKLFTLTPKELLADFVSRKFPIHYWEAKWRPPSKGKKGKMIAVETDQINPEAQKLKDALMARIKLLDTPENAIDKVIKGFEARGIKVSEVTGRVKTIKARTENINKFMDDKTGVLIFSSAGATGASYHASLRAKNQRKRQHYVLQAGWRADKVLQGMGRSHRADQRPGAEPKYWLATTDYGPEKRFTSTIMRRLEQIGSLSSGERRAAGQGLFSGEHNIDGAYTRSAIVKTLNDMVWPSHELRAKGFPSLTRFATITGLDVAGSNGVKESGTPELEKFLNRLLLANIDFGTVVFEQFFQNLTGLIDAAVADGTFNEGIETVTADSIEMISSEQVRNTDGLKTEWIRVRLETKVNILTWNDHISDLREQANFADIRVLQRRNSPQVFTARPLPKVEGQFRQQFELVGPYPQRDGKALTNAKRLVVGEDTLFQYNELKDGNKPDFKAISEVWKNEEETWPGGKFQEQNYVVGDILGIWDRLSFIADVKLHRLMLDDGRVLVGRNIPPTKVVKARENLQAELAQAEMDPEVIYKLLLEGASVRLVNNDQIKLRSVSDEQGAERKLVLDPSGVKSGGGRRDRIESIYRRFNVTHGEEINSGLHGFGVISSNSVFKSIVNRFPIAGIDGISDADTESLVTEKNKDPDIWLEEMTADEVESLKRNRLTFVTERFPKQKLYKVEGKKGQTFEHKGKIKQAGALWVNKIKRWIIGEELIDRINNDMKDVMSVGPVSAGSGISVELATETVRTIKEQWPAGPEVHVVNSLKEVTDLNFDTDTLVEGSTISGLFQPQSGRIWLIADQLQSPNHLASVLTHEMFHVGIRAMNLPGFDADVFLARVFASFKSHSLMKEVIIDYPVHDPKTRLGRINLADEFMAALSQKGQEAMTPKERTVIRRFIDAVKKALGKIPLIRDYINTVSDTELLDIMSKSFKAAMDYTGPTGGSVAETMFSVARPKLLYGVNEAGDVKMAAAPNGDGSYTVYVTEGTDILDKGKLKKQVVASRAQVLKMMSGKALTAETKTKRFGPKPNSAEIHVNYTIPDETKWDRLVSTFQDRFKRLNVTQEAFVEQGAVIDPEINTYRAEERFHGKVFERIRAFEDNLVEPLIDAIADAGKKFGVTQQDVDNYLYAKHAPEANARLQTMNPEAADNDRLSGRSNEWAEQTLLEFEGRRITDVLDGIAKRIYSINNKRLDLLEKEGLASAKAVKAMRDSYEFYVPLRGKPERQKAIDGVDASGISVGKGLSSRGRERYRYGRHSVAENMMIHSLLMMEETLIRVEKNRVGKTFLKFVQQFPNRDNWEVNTRQAKPRWDKDLGEIVWEARTYPPEQMIVWVDGREHSVFIKDPILRKSMLGLNVVQVSSIVQRVASITRFLAAMNTSFNPEFAISNLLRDLQTALINVQDKDLLKKHGLESTADVSKLGRQALKDLSPALRGAWNGLRKTDPKGASASVKEWMGWFDDFRANGGKIEFFSMNNVETKGKDLAKRIDRMNRGKIPVLDQMIWLKDWISDMNGAIENGIRLSTYKNLVTKGVGKETAASIARNLTVNFNRKGEIGNFMNALYMFFNAGIQGTARMFMAAKNPKIQKILMSLAAGGFFLAEMGRWMGGDDEDGENYYDKIPDWVKENNLILMKADGSGGFYKIPLPYGYNVMNVIGVSMNKAWHSFDEGGIKALKHESPAQAVRMISSVMNAFNPLGGSGGLLQMASPTVLDPFVQIKSNENFFQAPIRPTQPSYLQYEKPSSQLYWSSVSPVSKELAAWLNKATGGSEFKSGWMDFSPEDMDHLQETLLGGAGAFVSRTVDFVIAVANDDDVAIRDVPFVRRFADDTPEFIAPGKYRENTAELSQTLDAIKSARKDGNPQAASEIIRDNKRILALRGTMKSTESRLRKLRAQRRRIQDSKLPEQVKKDRIKAINEDIDSLQKKFNKRFKEAQKAA